MGHHQQQQQQQAFPGAQFVNDPMANMALQYGTSLASTGREFVDQKVSNQRSGSLFLNLKAG